MRVLEEKKEENQVFISAVLLMVEKDGEGING